MMHVILIVITKTSSGIEANDYNHHYFIAHGLTIGIILLAGLNAKHFIFHKLLFISDHRV